MKLPAALLEKLPPRSLDLAPEDWLWATWRERKPLPRPAPKPFDQAEAVKRLIQAEDRYGWSWNWSKAKIAVALSPEEAHFWFIVMTGLTQKEHETVHYMQLRENRQNVANTLVRQNFEVLPSFEEIKTRLVSAWLLSPEVVVPLFNLLSLEDFFRLLIDPEQLSLDFILKTAGGLNAKEWAEWNHVQLLEVLTSGFEKFVWPYLDEAELERMRLCLRPRLDMKLWPASPQDEGAYLFRLAARLGLHEVIEAGVKRWPDGSAEGWWSYYYHRPHRVIFGLGSAGRLETETRRLKLPLVTETHARAWLAHTEYGALDVVRDSILKAQKKEEAEGMINALSLAQAPETVPPMLVLLASPKVAQLARRWLEAHPEYTVAGALALVAEDDPLAGTAATLLSRLAQKGYGELLQSYLTYFPAETAARIQPRLASAAESDYPPFEAETTPAWLREALPVKPKKPERLPAAWADPTLFPPLVVDRRRLNEAQVTVLLNLLKKASLEQAAPAALASLKAQAEPAHLDDFVWRLFELWLQEGIAAKDKWALNGVGLLGSEALAFKLAQLVRVKVEIPEYKRIPLVESCLKAICHETSLMQFQGIAQKTKFKGLQVQARLAMEAIARERGLSREELEDRLVPDCGLDERGHRLFDFGPRQFHFVLGPQLKPLVRDAQGKLKSSLPQPGAKDDPARSGEALAAWKRLKKELSQALKLQTARLEEAMITGRRWSTGAFETVLVGHPVLFHLTRLLLWGGFDASGNLTATFRVTEDRSYADSDDEVLALAGIEKVGLIHPLCLPNDLKAAWGEIFSDYELIQPFPQVGRGCYHLEAAELEATEITRFAQLKVPAVSLVSLLEQRGWDRGSTADGGTFFEHSRFFPAANVTAVVRYDGIYAGDVVNWQDQSLQSCFFTADRYNSRRYWHASEKKLPLNTIDPVVVSEVLRDLALVAGKAK